MHSKGCGYMHVHALRHVKVNIRREEAGKAEQLLHCQNSIILVVLSLGGAKRIDIKSSCVTYACV